MRRRDFFGTAAVALVAPFVTTKGKAEKETTLFTKGVGRLGSIFHINYGSGKQASYQWVRNDSSDVIWPHQKVHWAKGKRGRCVVPSFYQSWATDGAAGEMTRYPKGHTRELDTTPGDRAVLPGERGTVLIWNNQEEPDA